jgi:hypothetical protein
MIAARRPRSGGPSADEAHDAPVVRELLSVLLEVRAHVDALGVQLERLHAQLERLDARVAPLEDARIAPLERRATPGAISSVVRLQPSAAARTPSLMLTDLSADMIDKVVSSLGPDDELAASLACRKLRDAIRSPVLPSGEQPRRPLTTRVRSLLGSMSKLQWGFASAGAPLSGTLLARVARLVLSWLRTRGCPCGLLGRQR